jgi:hypothetical protein
VPGKSGSTVPAKPSKMSAALAIQRKLMSKAFFQ